MAAFLKIRYISNGLLKNRIINANDIDVVEPFSGPAGRYVEETRSRIFMKNGTKYDMSVSVDEIQKILYESGTLIAEIQSARPERLAKVASAVPTPVGPVSLYKRPVVVKPSEAQAQKKLPSPEAMAKPLVSKHLDKARKLAEALRG
ncbi:MAG: hypothetical protein M3N08_02630 [Pseudomonadota bacterium]|nr:hypothetical protein [Pseudomonadota bacterium]